MAPEEFRIEKRESGGWCHFLEPSSPIDPQSKYLPSFGSFEPAESSPLEAGLSCECHRYCLHSALALEALFLCGLLTVSDFNFSNIQLCLGFSPTLRSLSSLVLSFRLGPLDQLPIFS